MTSAAPNGVPTADTAAAALFGQPPDATDSFPLAAQIPLKDFNLPEFPPQASHLRELTLTGDIKLDEYQSLVQSKGPDAIVTQPPLPNLPPSITHLTLELFGLGFPGNPPFLSRLARTLPNLRSLTLFSCLIDGLDGASRKDAERFFETLPLLSELHVIDSFARPGFFKTIGAFFESRAKDNDEAGLKLVDVSYTFRGHDDSDFLARVHGEELSDLISKGVVGASFDFVPEVVDDLAQAERGDKEKVAEGILPFASDGRAPAALKKRFESLSSGRQLNSLKVLNLGIWALRPSDVGHILYACAGGSEAALVDLTVSVLLEDNWVNELIKGLNQNQVGQALEGVEIVGVPDKATEKEKDWKDVVNLIKQSEVEKLARSCPKLSKFGMSILKVKSTPHVVFLNDDGAWKEG